MNAAQARPMQSTMLALLDELHYVLFVITLQDLLATLKRVSNLAGILLSLPSTVLFIQIYFIHHTINNHEQYVQLSKKIQQSVWDF